jgi:hypothetical protein
MLAEALIYKFGQAEGLTIVDGVITEYPSAWGTIPDQAGLDTIVADYLPHKQWLDDLSAFDEKMPRTLEDVIDAVGTTSFDSFLVGLYNQKKTVRAAKPV